MCCGMQIHEHDQKKIKQKAMKNIYGMLKAYIISINVFIHNQYYIEEHIDTKKHVIDNHITNITNKLKTKIHTPHITMQLTNILEQY